MNSSSPSLLLEVRHISKRFGGLQALDDVSLAVRAGTIHGLIGPNGAGKTSLFNVITGLYTPDAGEFTFMGRPWSPTAVHEVARSGIARTFQNIRLFGQMSALENVSVGQHVRTRAGALASVLRTRAQREEEARIRDRSLHWLDYVGIGALAGRRASTLAYGDQRRLEIARALATEPRLLALDEPAAGMNGAEKQALGELLGRIRRECCTILLIEHDVRLVMSLCDEVTVLDHGRLIARGEPSVVRHDPQVIAAWLGGARA